eukprot:COSAG02_NODE_1975_length_10211_cov_8.737737_4_plen_74_part_00
MSRVTTPVGNATTEDNRRRVALLSPLGYDCAADVNASRPCRGCRTVLSLVDLCALALARGCYSYRYAVRAREF